MKLMAEDKIFTSFSCQRCLQPLRLDDSLNSFGEHILAELTLPINSNPDVDLESQATSFDHFVNPYRLYDSTNGANGFMLISDEAEFETMGQQMKIKATLFDTLSGHSNIDHPLCDDCAEALLKILEQELTLTENDYEDYSKYLKKLETEQEGPKLTDLEKELEDLKSEEQRLIDKLTALQEEEVATLKAISEQEVEAKRLEKEELRYWQEYTKHRRDFLVTEDDARSLDCQTTYTQTQLDKLKKTNVFNATFHIWHAGHFGTINSFRLGRLPSAPVDWSEINAAWGQTTLLLSALARRVNLKFDKYKLIPFGNHSYIEVVDEQKELPLFGTGGFRFLWDTKFDAAMAVFLECIQQFEEKLGKGERDFCLPYRMTRGKIEDSATMTSYCIKIQFNSEEQWTKAVKFMLTNLKWILAWVSSQFSSDGDELQE